jgi:hypothetical protein
LAKRTLGMGAHLAACQFVALAPVPLAVEETIQLGRSICLEIRLKSAPATAPLVVQADEESEVKVEVCFTELSKGGDCPAGVAAVTPPRAHPRHCDALLFVTSRGHCHPCLGNGVSKQSFKRPRVVRIVTGEHAHRFGIDNISCQPPRRDVRQFVGTNQAQLM